ncbi:flagellar motor switch protein FliN [Pseudarthrobacter sp. AG30]|uniref:flagellar motor switch protein FliN n=1 Tax=unclassified Pseudarthrobacter TaxID=2647000 RepID=UPI000D64D377|nr:MULTISPECIES: flagellar motor switch protein FliN [unclassified Pseudarthrobacter]RAX16998.1 flagellar motor switch protein FliN [Pseudarthrobacter sp. AG30]
MTITLNLHESSAQQLALHLPHPAVLSVSGIVPPLAAAAYAPQGIAATFVGAVTADLALVLADRSFLAAAGGAGAAAGGGAPGLVSAVDILRPAMEAAAAVFDAGVLGELREEDAAGLLSDPETAVFELTDGTSPAGWFAVRVREHGTVHDAGRGSRRDSGVPARLSLISNVEMSLTVEIGRTRMSVRDALALEPGKVIELDRSAGAPADVLLNGRLIAHGEVVVVDQDYAVRITRILDTAEGLG